MSGDGDVVTIGRVRDGDLAEIMGNFGRFWNEPESGYLRGLHHAMFFVEFGDTAFVARNGRGEIVGYLLGLVAPTGDGYVHFVAVRDDARHLGLGRQLYEAFTAAARERGASGLKAITSPENTGSLTFHENIGFTDMTRHEDYAGSGRTRIVMRKQLT
jgi:ribosomal protein S18 acetylase RimI-like enzyme